MAAPIPLVYTFGNHMHWVDMEWLWGYHVLPGSVADMLRFTAETGARGNVNFDGVGYEKLAVEDPKALDELRRAVQSGVIEPVGASYGQPYGLFHGGESNVRQRVYGVRATLRQLGVRPRTFWEEEFDFFPQLPQILAGCGFTGASLYFQWTWHTPEVPMEEDGVVWWEGVDGTRLKCATRNRLNLHQWPEDFALLLDDLAAHPPGAAPNLPLILQWLELMPSPDWMCRSELMAPMLRRLQADPRFVVRTATLGEYLASTPEDLPVRTYGLDEVWHGMTLGKNGDRLRILSAQTERELRVAESLAATLSLFGRPYPRWDVYPTWELEEGWRAILTAQHHDNDECEGLCGDIGATGYGQARRHAQIVHDRTWELVRRRHPGPEVVADPSGLGWAAIPARSSARALLVAADGDTLSFDAGGPRLTVDFAARVPDALARVTIETAPHPLGLQVSAHVTVPNHRRFPGYGQGIRFGFQWTGVGRVLAGLPHGFAEAQPSGPWRRKYPEGDWMTSPQWFEDVDRTFYARDWVLLEDGTGGGWLVSPPGGRQWFFTDEGIELAAWTYDPWDEAHGIGTAETGFFVAYLDEAVASHAVQVAEAMHGTATASAVLAETAADLPAAFRPFAVVSGDLVPAAFYREESGYAGLEIDGYAAADVSHPFILRLVDYSGTEQEVTIVLPGPIAGAWRTDMMGAALEALETRPWQGDPMILGATTAELARSGITLESVSLSTRPFEILTISLDLVPGRKQFRDLDAKREVWATVHRVD